MVDMPAVGSFVDVPELGAGNRAAGNTTSGRVIGTNGRMVHIDVGGGKTRTIHVDNLGGYGPPRKVGGSVPKKRLDRIK